MPIPDIKENTTLNEVEVKDYVLSIEEVDYSDCFDGIENADIGIGIMIGLLECLRNLM